jgi:phosphopantothenoylcysteine synthetase/decarboxylase
MNHMVKESAGRKSSNDPEADSMQIKRNTTKDVKKYLPSSAFNKTVKSSTTKSLLKFRQRQEQQEFKRTQQYKSYQRVMKREGYHTNNNKSSRKRHRDDTTTDEHVDDEAEGKVTFDSDAAIIESDAKSGVSKSISECIHDSPTHESYKQKLSTANTPENVEKKVDGSKHAIMSTGSGDDLQGKH